MAFRNEGENLGYINIKWLTLRCFLTFMYYRCFTKNPYFAKNITYVQGQQEHHTKKNTGREIKFFEVLSCLCTMCNACHEILICSYLHRTHIDHDVWRTMEIQVLVQDRHKHVAGLDGLMGSQYPRFLMTGCMHQDVNVEGLYEELDSNVITVLSIVI